MMKVLRRQVRQLRQALMADRPPQERTMVIVTGIGLTSDDATRAWICDTIENVQRERADLPAAVPPPPIVPDDPPLQRPEVEPMGKPAEPTKSSPPAEPAIYFHDPNDPKNDWMLVVNKPPPGPRPPPPGPYRDPLDDPLGLYR